MTCEACVRPPVSPCCSAEEPTPYRSSRLYKAIVTVCSIALGAFACYTAPLISAICGSIGFVIGSAYVIYKKVNKEEIPDILARPTCALGVYDLFSRIPVSMEISAFIASFYFAGHIAHSPYAAGFFSIPIGMGLGKMITEVAIDLGSRLITHIKSRDFAPIHR